MEEAGLRRRFAMDPINYLPHGPQRLSSHSDGPTGPWMADAHNLATSPWLPHSSVSPLYFPQAQPPRPHPSLDPLQFGLQGALPHPDRNMRGPASQQHPDGLAGLPAPPGHWGSSLHSISGLASAASAGQGGLMAHPGNVAGGGGLGPGAGFGLQPQGAVNMGPPGATSETHSLHGGSLLSPHDRLANAYGQQPGTPSHFSIPHPTSLNYSSPRRSAANSSSPTTPRSHQPHSSTSSPVHTSRDTSALPSPVSDRRRQGYSRARRYMTSRQTASDPIRDSDDDDGRQTVSDPAEGRTNRREGQGSNHVAWDEAAVRQLQLVRGAASSKMVASRLALQSLQCVNINELSDNERTCVICYNDYGVESPEGINEDPLRLPKCKHVFGDHCIKKWFEDSDSCPYCRDKLPSEPKHSHGSARSFMNMMRMHGVSLPAGIPEHFYSRLMGASVGDLEFVDAVARQGRTAERRAPPDDAAGEDQRRTRQRRSSPSPVRPASSSASRGGPPIAQPGPSGPSRPLASSVQGFLIGPPSVQSHWSSVPTQTHSQAERRSATSPMAHQEAGQNGPVERPASLFAIAPYQVPTLSAAAGSLRSQARGGNNTHHHGQGLQGTPDQGGLLGPFGSDGQLPNPLQGLSRVGGFGGASGNIPSLRPGNTSQVRATHQANAEAVQSERPPPPPPPPQPPSLFGPNRNRPW